VGRTPECRFWKSRGDYRCRIDGKEVPLGPGPDDYPSGPNYRAALERYDEVMKARKELKSTDTHVAALCERYVQQLEEDGQLSTLKQTVKLLKSAVKAFGHKYASCVVPADVEDWLRARKTWSRGTKHTAFSRLSRVFNWALKRKDIRSHCLADVDLAQIAEVQLRGAECVLPEALADLLIEQAGPCYGAYLRALRVTGARPAEIAFAEDYHYSRRRRCLVFDWRPTKGYRWKCARKTKKNRYIFLPDALADEVEEKIKSQGPGHIWRGKRGGLYTSDHVRAVHWGRLCEMGPVVSWLDAHGHSREHVVPYSFRHTYATNAILAGINHMVLAKLMGTSVAMVERHYAHLDADLDTMREIALRHAGGSK
jgi:integrase